MVVPVNWENAERTVLRFDECGTWTWAEFDQAVDQAVAYIRSVEHPVSVIALLPPRFPPGLPLLHIQRAMLHWPPNVGKIVLVGSSQFQKYLNHILMLIFPKLQQQLIFVDTIEEAYQVLAEPMYDSSSSLYRQ